jgi:protoporphyrin/coproporphyrin ferrochelatase
MKTGVVLLNLGGPDSSEAVEPFLFNLFRDPEIINFPFSFLFRKKLAKIISEKRAPRIIEQYNQIGGKSPINEITMKQANALEKNLTAKGIDAKVYVAMRYWHPFTEEVLDQIINDKIEKVILLPLYPQFSKSTTGSSVIEWYHVINERNDWTNPETSLVDFYFEHPVYLQSVVERINDALLRFPEEKRGEVYILFSSHGTPIKLVKEGDPYSIHIRKTVEAVMNEGGFSQQHSLSFQSKVGPQKWLKPSTPEKIEELSDKGVKNLLIVPIAFVSDHLETLFEIGIEFRELAHEKGYEQFEVTEGLNDSPKFIEALADLVMINLRDVKQEDVLEIEA